VHIAEAYIAQVGDGRSMTLHSREFFLDMLEKAGIQHPEVLTVLSGTWLWSALFQIGVIAIIVFSCIVAWRWFNGTLKLGHRIHYPGHGYKNWFARLLGAFFPWQIQTIYECFHPSGRRKARKRSTQRQPSQRPNSDVRALTGPEPEVAQPLMAEPHGPPPPPPGPDNASSPPPPSISPTTDDAPRNSAAQRAGPGMHAPLAPDFGVAPAPPQEVMAYPELPPPEPMDSPYLGGAGRAELIHRLSLRREAMRHPDEMLPRPPGTDGP